jgi:hypothetical protein
MYKVNPYFKNPDRNKVKVWRYMDFTKFANVIDKQQLFFSRSDKLGDVYEGSYPIKNVKQRKLDNLKLLNGLSPSLRISYKKRPEELSKLNKNIRKFVFVNCWHENDHESAAMWKLYLHSNEGIAIQSTFACLKSCFEEEPLDVYIGKLEYRDYLNQKIPENSLFSPFLHKRSSFEHERELRAVVLSFNMTKDNLPDLNNPLGEGIYIKVDLEKLIQNIYVAPTSPQWFVNLVKSVSKKYGLKKPILQSQLDKKPVY